MTFHVCLPKDFDQPLQNTGIKELPDTGQARDPKLLFPYSPMHNTEQKAHLATERSFRQYRNGVRRKIWTLAILGGRRLVP